MFVQVDSNNRVIAAVELKEYSTEEYIDVEAPEGFTVENSSDYILSDGVLVYDGAYSAHIELLKKEIEYSHLRNSQIPVAMSMFVQSTPMARQAAISVSAFYDEWSDKSVKYKKGQWVRYQGDLYQVELDHTSQASWTPDVSPSLFTRFKLAADGIRIWEQPTHAENAFDIGERCHYPDEAGALYESKIDGNTTVPGSDDRYWNKLPE